MMSGESNTRPVVLSIGAFSLAAFLTGAPTASGLEPVQNLTCEPELSPCRSVILSWTNGDDYDRIVISHYSHVEVLEEHFPKGRSETLPFWIGDYGHDYEIWVLASQGDLQAAGAYCAPDVPFPEAPRDLRVSSPVAEEVLLRWDYFLPFSSVEITVNGEILDSLDGLSKSYSATLKGGTYQACVEGSTCEESETERKSCSSVVVEPRPVEDLVCEVLPCEFRLSWVNGTRFPGGYDAIEVNLDGNLSVMLPGPHDPGPGGCSIASGPPDLHEVCIAPVRGGIRGAATCSSAESRGCPLLFRRGDSNADGTTDISDAVAILGFLFLGSTMNDCKDAADVNDDGVVDISDPVRLLGFLFLGSERPPDPFTACGVDSSGDELDCKTFDECP